jgi:soluble lytic murein transglycosylase
MTISFFKKLYKSLLIGAYSTMPLAALSPEQEVNACKSALLAQINKQNKLPAKGCPVSQKLVYWLGILRNPEQFTPQELITFLNSHTHWPTHQNLCQKVEQVIATQGSTQEILTWFEKNPPQTPMGVKAYAEVLLAQNEKQKAAKIVAEAWKSMELTQTEEKKLLSSLGHLLQKKDYIARLQFLLWNENVADAQRILSHIPTSMRNIADVRIAFITSKSIALQKMKALHAKEQQDEGLLYETAKWHRKQKDFQLAANILIKSSESPAYAPKWWKERNYIAREFIALGEYQKAYQLLKSHKLQSGCEDFSNAEFLLGWLSLRFLEKPKEAQQHFTTLFANVEGAISKARGAYWLGRTQEALNNIAQAETYYKKAAQYKATYYGQLAAAKIRTTPYPSLASASKASANDKKNFHNKDIVKAAHILKNLGNPAKHELSKFLLHIADQSKTKTEGELAVQLAHTLSPYDVVWAAKKAGYKEPIALAKAYPVHAIPKKGQIIPEKALVMAVAYQESRFNPTVQSSAGAMGLLQLMPQTAAQEAKLLKITHNESKLFDPQHNLHLGTSHLSKLLNNFDSSYILAIAAYNAGPTPVARWCKDFGDPRQGTIDIIDWIELIPYAETRNYVMRVLETITIYRSLEGTPQKTLLDDLTR